MRNTKWMRFLLIALSVVMVLSLFACGNGGTEEETTVDNTTEDTTVEDTTVEDTTVEDTTVEDTTVEDTTVEDTTVEDTTVDETTEEETTVPAEPTFEGNWHVSVDAFVHDADGALGNYATGDYSEIDAIIGGANTNKTNGITIMDAAGATYPSVANNYVWFAAGWVAFDGYDVENFVCKVYDAEGNLLKTVELGLNDAEEGVVNHVSQNMGYGAGTVAHRMTFDSAELINLKKYEGTTVTLVYSVDVVGTEFTVDVIKLDVEVPALPEGYITGEAIYNAGVHSNYTATLNDDGTVTVTSNQAGADQAINLTAFATITTKYMVVKYKTTGASTPYIYATTTSGAIGGNITAAVNTDGEWHYIAVDLTRSADYTLGEAVTFLRLDVCEGAAGEAMTIEYVQLTDDISDIAHLLEKNYINNVDKVELNGAIATYVGWVAVDGYAATNVCYVVTDAEGNETVVTLEKDAEDTVPNRWRERADVTGHVKETKGFSDATVGCGVDFTADLSAWAGQNVNVSIKVELNDGSVLKSYSVDVTIPAAQ